MKPTKRQFALRTFTIIASSNANSAQVDNTHIKGVQSNEGGSFLLYLPFGSNPTCQEGIILRV